MFVQSVKKVDEYKVDLLGVAIVRYFETMNYRVKCATFLLD